MKIGNERITATEFWDLEIARMPYLYASQKAEALIDTGLKSIRDDARWLDENADFISEHMLLLSNHGVIGRVPVLKLLRTLSAIPADERSPEFENHVMGSFRCLVAVTLETPAETNEVSGLVVQALKKISTSDRGIRQSRALLEALGSPWSALVDELGHEPTRVDYQFSQRQLPPRQTRNGLLAIEAREKALTIDTQSLKKIDDSIYEYAQKRFEAHEYFTVASGRLARDLRTELSSGAPNSEITRCIIRAHHHLSRFLWRNAELDSLIHDAYQDDKLEVSRGSEETLMFSFSSYLNDEDFSAVWKKFTKRHPAGEMKPATFAVAVTRGVETSDRWKYQPTRVGQNLEKQNSFERWVGEALKRFAEQSPVPCTLHSEERVAGYYVDHLLRFESGRRIVVECDGIYQHYRNGDPLAEPMWDETIRENAIRATGAELVRIPNTRWSQHAEGQDGIIASALSL